MRRSDPAPGAGGVRRARQGGNDSKGCLLGELFSIEADFSFDPEKQRRGLADLLGRGDEACLLVCEREGEVVGMCSVQALVSTAEGGKVGLVEDMVVAGPWMPPRWRRPK